MSTLILRPSAVTGVTVMARGFDDEPAKLTVAGLGEAGVEMFGSDPNKTICLPRHLVYQFNEHLFTRLKDFFERGRAKQLAHAWNKADKFHE